MEPPPLLYADPFALLDPPTPAPREDAPLRFDPVPLLVAVAVPPVGLLVLDAPPPPLLYAEALPPPG